MPAHEQPVTTQAEVEELPIVYYRVRLSKHEVMVRCRDFIVDTSAIVFHDNGTVAYACSIWAFVEMVPTTESEWLSYMRKSLDTVDFYEGARQPDSNAATQYIPRQQ